jgi:hypothetical protein
MNILCAIILSIPFIYLSNGLTKTPVCSFLGMFILIPSVFIAVKFGIKEVIPFWKEVFFSDNNFTNLT